MTNPNQSSFSKAGPHTPASRGADKSTGTNSPILHRIELSQGFFSIIDECDLDILSSKSWFLKRHKGKDTLYAHANLRREDRSWGTILMHRFIMNAATGQMVDHINGDGLDNRRSNLRFVTNQQNQFNSKPHGALSGYKGVCLDVRTNRWQTKIRVDKKDLSIGTFATKEEAALAYNRAALEFYGEYARLNNVVISGEPL